MTENNNDNNFNGLQNNNEPDNNQKEPTQSNPEENSNPTSGQPQQPVQQTNSNQQFPYLYSWDGKKQPPTKKNKGLKAFAAIVTVCLLFTVILIVWSINMGYGPNPLHENSDNVSETTSSNEASLNENKESTTSVPEVIATGDDKAENTSNLTKLYNKIKSSCVTVQTNTALGSGFVVSEDGYIITNHHVIDAAKNISVIFYDNTKYSAKLIGSDEVRDIAVLKIEGEFTPIDIGNSDSLEIGERVVAVGTPYNISLAGTMNEGIISGIARDIDVTNDNGAVVKRMTLIQTDTSINPGNSGGPLINMAGQVIGINTLKLMDEYEGLGFAIPIKNAVNIANTLIEHGAINERPNDDFVTATAKLNVIVMNVSDAINEENLNSSIDLPDGAYIIQVARSSSIYMAGLELYDIITEFNGVRVNSKEELIIELKKCQAGETVSIKVFRLTRKNDSGDYHEFNFKLDSAS